jgi:hypothetical protein
MMAGMSVAASFLLRLRVEQGRVVLELQELRSGQIHRFDGVRALWRFLQGRLPGLH